MTEVWFVESVMKPNSVFVYLEEEEEEEEEGDEGAPPSSSSTTHLLLTWSTYMTCCGQTLLFVRVLEKIRLP